MSAGEAPDEELARAAPLPCRRRLDRRRPTERASEREEKGGERERRPRPSERCTSGGPRRSPQTQQEKPTNAGVLRFSVFYS